MLDATDEATPSDVFAFLGNETRLAILNSLYDLTVESGPLASTATYTDLRTAVGVEDSGRFSYHLDKLTGLFLDKSADGYRLLESGIQVVRLNRTGLLASHPTAGPAEVDGACYRCGGTPKVVYDQYKLVAYCPACAGGITHGTIPDGSLVAMSYPPAGVDPDDIAEAFERGTTRAEKFDQLMYDGFCPHCCDDVRVDLEPCADHAPADNGVCPECGRSHGALMRLACEGCGHHRVTHPLLPVSARDPVAGALESAETTTAWQRISELMRWPATVRDCETAAFEAPDGRVLVVNGREITVE
ncbi:hypothetical protein JCM17823_14770 [Halorubrum gandharaense]